MVIDQHEDSGDHDVSDDGDTWDKLWSLLEAGDGAAVVYVYRLDAEDQSQKPYLLRYSARPQLPEVLRDRYGGGDFLILIRRGRKMVFRGKISIAASPVKGRPQPA